MIRLLLVSIFFIGPSSAFNFSALKKKSFSSMVQKRFETEQKKLKKGFKDEYGGVFSRKKYEKSTQVEGASNNKAESPKEYHSSADKRARVREKEREKIIGTFEDAYRSR